MAAVMLSAVAVVATDLPARAAPLRHDRTPALVPVGVPDSAEPSGLAPPGMTQLPGFHLSLVDDFSASGGLTGWTTFEGTAMGDPGGQFASSNVSVVGGVMRLNASPDAASAGQWVTGGVCQCSVNQVYGAFFVRSRVTGPGPTQVEMLMPRDGWPPEVDFNETRQSDQATTATLHYSAANLQIYRHLSIDLTQWHTWGVIWTPAAITYTVDGRVWGSVSLPSAIPAIPMHLDITQQTWCASGFACPTTPESTLVNWVAEYQPNSDDGATVGIFAPDSATLTASLTREIARTATRIARQRDSSVSVIAFGTDPATSPSWLAQRRAAVVARQLRSDLSAIGDRSVSVSPAAGGASPPSGLGPALAQGPGADSVVLWMT